jgi:hypothetical protein
LNPHTVNRRLGNKDVDASNILYIDFVVYPADVMTLVLLLPTARRFSKEALGIVLSEELLNVLVVQSCGIASSNNIKIVQNVTRCVLTV